MPNLQVTARHRIHNGKLEEFKKATEQCLSLVNEKDKNTLQFDCYFNQDQTECVFRETYPDSNALLVHIGNIGDAFGKQLQLADFEAEIYGSPSEELLQAVAGLKIKVYSPYQG
jgi:quinol monooxygenase YgiN